MSTAADAHEIMRQGQMPLGPTRAAATSDEGTGLDAGEAWRIIKQHKLLVFVSFVIFALLAAGITFVVYRWFPLYPAVAILELEPPPADPMQISEQLVQPAQMEFQLQTEAAKLTQLSLLQDVLAQPEIQRTSLYQKYHRNNELERLLFDFQDMVSSVPIKDTNLIQVSFEWSNPDEAREIVNMIVDRYWQQFRRSAADTGATTLDDLKATKSDLTVELQRKRDEIKAFRATTDVPSMNNQRTPLEDNIAYLTRAMSELSAQAADYQAQIDSVRGLSPEQLPITPEIEIIVEADPILRFYRSQVEQLDIELATAEKNLIGRKHRQYATLIDRQKGYMEKEASRREELIDQLRGRQLEMYRENLARTRSIQARIQNELEVSQAQMQDLNNAAQKYSEMVADEELLRHSLLTVEERVSEAQHAARVARSKARLNIVQKPLRAVQPSRPNLILFLGGGFVLSIVGAVGLAFLREFTDKAVRTPLDVTRISRLSVLGCVPVLDDEEADVDEIELATRVAPHSLVAEAFRQVRTNLRFSGPSDTQRLLLITSPRPEDGKTAVAINLAVTLAQSDEKVLLVDCNFRRPAFRKAFPNTRSEGLSNVLIGQAQLADVITRTDIPNLDVVTSGPTPPTPSELLGSAFMARLIADAAQRYNRVIFDGPPVLLVSDALVIAKQVDGVILVTRAVTNSKGALKRAREQFDRIGARVVGAILNGVKAQAGGYFRQQYREFYDYTLADETPPELPSPRRPDPDEDE